MFSSRPAEAEAAYKTAIERSEDILRTDPTSPGDLYVQGWALAATGQDDKGRELVQRALDLAPSDPYAHYYDALLKLGQGDSAASTNALTSAVDLGYPVEMLSADPLFNDLRDDEGFREIVGKN